MVRALTLALAFALLPAPALASHMGQYHTNPVEHDDQGSSAEPDRAATSVLGPALEGRTVDGDLDYVAEPDTSWPAGKVLAPGCTDLNGTRQPSGMCGLWTVGLTTGYVNVPPHTLGIAEGSGPGLTGKDARTVRFLDARIDVDLPTAAAGSVFINVNRKLGDLGATPGPIIPPGPVALWAWYGTFSDMNGNGVIDHLAPYDDSGGVHPDNEFVWGGECTAFDGTPTGPTPYCVPDPAGSSPRMYAWIWPGNHHAFCGGFVDPLGITCSVMPADLPGRQVVAFADALSPNLLYLLPVPIGSGCTFPFFTDSEYGCIHDIDDIDRQDEAAFGDPLLGPQESPRPDGRFHDRAGDPSTNVRHFVYGDGWAMWFYDQSLLVDTVVVVGMGCPPSLGSVVDLPRCRFADVDDYPSVNPAISDLVQGTAKPAARGAWVLLRDDYEPLRSILGGLPASRAVYEATLGPLRGELGDRLDDPGFAREPNQGAVAFAGNAGDAYPGALRGGCTGPDAGERTFKGWCNRYDGYAAARHAWADLLPSRLAAYLGYNTLTPGSQCIQCFHLSLPIPFAGEPMPGAFPRPHGNHNRTLGPGTYNWLGVVGLWQDKPQTWREAVFDPATLQASWVTYTNTKDGWIGNIVNATGTFYNRGYMDEECDTDQGPGRHTYAECHPYLDGNLGYPQQAGDNFHGEWSAKRCETTYAGSPNIRISFYPRGGVWTVPVYRHVQYQNGFALVDPAGPTLLHGLVLEDRTGSTGPITVTAACAASGESGFFLSNDLLVLPHGNLGLDIASVLVTSVPTSGGARETVQDVDYYVGWGV